MEWTRVVAKLISETKEGTREWNLAGAVERDGKMGDAYVTTADNLLVAVYEYRFQNYISDLDDYAWANEVAIEFIADNGTLRWRFPQVPNRWDLLEAVRYKMAGADAFPNKFLRGDQT